MAILWANPHLSVRAGTGRVVIVSDYATLMVAGYRGDFPRKIAISVAAEMIAHRRNAGSNWRALSLSVLDGRELTVLSM